MTKKIIDCSIVLSVLLVAPAASDAQRRSAAGAAGEFGEFQKMPPVPLPSGTQVERDVAYGSDAAQRLDVYRPTKARRAPIIVMVHGGGWWRGDKGANGVVGHKIAHWVPKGFIVVSVNYRLVPSANPRQQADDVAKALAYVQGQAPTWGGDPKRIVLIGHSAGAHLVALLGAAPSIAAGAGAKPWLATIALDSAAYDVSRVMTGAHFSLYDRAFGTDEALWRAASPALNVEGKAAPMMLVCSTKRAESCAMADGFATELRKKGGRAEVVRENMTHGEINAYFGKPGAYTDQADRFFGSLGLK